MNRIIGLLAIMFFLFSSLVASTDVLTLKKADGSTYTLEGEVKYYENNKFIIALNSGTQFIITNNNSFDWRDVEITINPSGFFMRGFVLKVPRIQSGGTYTVGAMQFAKGVVFMVGNKEIIAGVCANSA